MLSYVGPKAQVGPIFLLLHESRPSGPWLIFDVSQMKIDDAVQALESVLVPDLRAISAKWPDLRLEVFSHRHAVELHVFGITCDCGAFAEEFKLLVLRVAICTLGSESIKGEVVWFRSRADLGVADCILSTSGLDARSIRDFTSKWPSLLKAHEAAVDRRYPASAQ